jgi:hypothetical protein
MPINMLPDDVLLAIFDFCMQVCVVDRVVLEEEIEAWQPLVHVCQQWRRVVFGSPHRLKLRLYCKTKTRTPLRDTLSVWPALPLIIDGNVLQPEDLDNITALLERSDHAYRIKLSTFVKSHRKQILAAMQKPFPELTHLHLSSNAVTVVPDAFLGGSAPRLRQLYLYGIPFPGLPKLLLSATHLRELHLVNIPHSGYFSPEALVTALSMLTSLRLLSLEFQSPQPRPYRRPPPLTRSVLPFLRSLRFKGVSEYLEDLVARIDRFDTPQLFSLRITLFNQIVFDTPQFIQFITHTPRLKALKEARLAFKNDAAEVTISSPFGPGYGNINVEIKCRESGWQFSSLEQVCTRCLPPLSALENLYIYENPKSPPDWRDDIENTLWLELLHPFSAVKNLYLSEEFVPRVAPALQELVGGRTAEVLPTLQNIFLEGRELPVVQEGIATFVAARQLSGHPITVSLWERDGTIGGP